LSPSRLARPGDKRKRVLPNPLAAFILIGGSQGSAVHPKSNVKQLNERSNLSLAEIKKLPDDERDALMREFAGELEAVAEIMRQLGGKISSVLRDANSPRGELFDYTWLNAVARQKLDWTDDEFWDATPWELLAHLEAWLQWPERIVAPSKSSGRPGQRKKRTRGYAIDGEKLKRLRGSMTQRELASKADVSLSVIQRGEAGGPLDSRKLYLIAEALGDFRGQTISLDDLKPR